ncbi:MFS transporter [Brevibacillus fluminis]|uniref:MFS transporter n=1 Tax=Brevibacillus fluminis TaxID=511487 RepID=A0A3M8DQG5_9BACL|nr:aromatic acid/H+ symport family MFS transporter [Brevibacillus fluminis]RNB89675.1 MFS transporter [Brevibacillus fluminis]
MEQIRANQLIDQAKFNRFHMMLIFWCFLIIVFDGYDVVLYGLSVPFLMKEWSLTPIEVGAIGSYTAIGTAIGAILFGFAADKIGRKKVIIFSVLQFSLFTALAGFANGPVMFTVFRIIAGLGLGGVMPNVIALTADYTPKAIRNALVSIVFCGYSIGSVAAAMIGKSLLPAMGWKPIFWIAGIPLLFVPILVSFLPESISSLLAKGKEDELRAVLRRANPANPLPNSLTFEKLGSKHAGSPIVKLFEKKRTVSTLMFWICFFCAFVLIYAMSTWLPKLMLSAGYDLGSSMMFVVFLNLGAIVGTIVLGTLTNRFGFKKVLVPLYASGGIAFLLLGFKLDIAVIYTLTAVIGAASIGAQNIANAFVAEYYPAQIRSTGLGMSFGFGRIGGVVAPTLVGVLLTMNLSFQMNFLFIGIAGLIAAIAAMFVQEAYADREELLQAAG